MTRAEGLKIAARILGKRMYWRENADGARDVDELATRRAEFDRLKGEAQQAEEAREARYKAVLAGDAEYQTLKTRAKDAREARAKAGARLMPRIELGTTSDLGGFQVGHIKASGMNWADVIRTLQAKTD